MKALLCTRLGPPESLVLTEELPSPKPSAGEVKLRILVAGINFPDTLMHRRQVSVQTRAALRAGGRGRGAGRGARRGRRGPGRRRSRHCLQHVRNAGRRGLPPRISSHQAARSQPLGPGSGRLPDDLRDLLLRPEAQGRTPRRRDARGAGGLRRRGSRGGAAGEGHGRQGHRLRQHRRQAWQCAKRRVPTS